MTTFRRADLHIQAASERGYVVLEGGDTVAAFGTAAELAYWLQSRLEIEEQEIRRALAEQAEQAEQAEEYRGSGAGASAEGGPQDFGRHVGEAAASPARDLPVLLRPEPPRPRLTQRLFGAFS